MGDMAVGSMMLIFQGFSRFGSSSNGKKKNTTWLFRVPAYYCSNWKVDGTVPIQSLHIGLFSDPLHPPTKIGIGKPSILTPTWRNIPGLGDTCLIAMVWSLLSLRIGEQPVPNHLNGLWTGHGSYWKWPGQKITFACQVFVTFLGWLSDPFGRLSDLQLGDKKVTLNHLVNKFFLGEFSQDCWPECHGKCWSREEARLKRHGRDEGCENEMHHLGNLFHDLFPPGFRSPQMVVKSNGLNWQ